MFKSNKKKVEVINIEGVIEGGSSSKSLLAKKNGADDIIKKLHEIANDDSIHAVLIRINSPGGAAAASQEIYEMIQEVSENKPVVASMADVACSGGYMIASACDYIVASPSTFTGSIGVIMQLPNYKSLADKIGYTVETIKAGNLKDIGNPMREMTDEEKSLLNYMAKECHDEFIRLVVEGRRLTEGEVKPIADGRILTGKQAFDLKLVDELGNYFTAVNKVCELLDCDEDDIKFVEEKEPSFLSKLLSLDTLADKVLPKMGIMFK